MEKEILGKNETNFVTQTLKISVKLSGKIEETCLHMKDGSICLKLISEKSNLKYRQFRSWKWFMYLYYCLPMTPNKNDLNWKGQLD